MIRAAAVLLLLVMACTVPNLEELNGDCDEPLTPTDVAAGPVDAAIGRNSACRGMKVTVAYSESGFLPGCVRVVAREPASGGQHPEAIINKDRLDSGEPLVVAVLPPGNWGPSMEVEVQSFEKTCTGQVVETQTTSVTLVSGQVGAAELRMNAADQDQDGFASRATGGTDCLDTNSTVNPDVQEERCNNLDDNCDTVLDETVFQLGQPCSVGTYCTGARQCAGNGTVTCGNPQGARTAYRDQDGDGYGNNAAAITYCEATPPAGYSTNPRTDCNDNNSAVNPGVYDVCNYVDDDCDGAEDENFDVGVACTASSGGPGRYECTSDEYDTYCQAF